jgi:hypothetical protein
MKDEEGIVQVFEVSVLGGEVRKVTALPAPLQAQFNLSPDGRTIALIADNSIWLADAGDGKAKRLTARTNDGDAPVLTVNWNHGGNTLVYNRYAGSENERYLQIYKLKLN